jgi:4-amino-4-deoxy-L-arabinose transferase-like glycosyltransferase
VTRQRILDTGYLALLWFAMIVPLFVLRPLWPIIETRYVSVAWEMWLRHDFLVPYLNGAPYSHKPPLLFWAIHAGWWLFGVNSWWPRVVPSLFTFGTIILALRIGRLLWPERREIAAFLPFMLFGSLLWCFYMTFVMFDLLVAFSAAVGMYGLLHALLRNRLAGFLLFGLGIGLGVLSKGPVILVVLLPVALAAPWWGRSDRRQNWRAWYGGVAGSLLLGAIIGLAWALPAARSGGEAYGQALLWKQTADRVVQSFAHQQPWWWYLPLLPLLLFPWPWLPALWRAARRLNFHDRGVRFCLAWFVLPLLLFSLISGKQVHYLLPIFPAFFLLAVRLAADVSFSYRDCLPQVFLFGFLGVVWLAFPSLSGGLKLPSWVYELSPAYGVVLLLLSLLFLVIARRRQGLGVKAMSALTVCTIVVLQAGILDGAAEFYDIRPLSAYLAQVQGKGYPIANSAKYEAQYQFLGRLRHPLEVITEAEVSGWLAAHPHGRVVRYFRQWPQETGQQVEFAQPFRGQFAVVVASPTPGNK